MIEIINLDGEILLKSNSETMNCLNDIDDTQNPPWYLFCQNRTGKLY